MTTTNLKEIVNLANSRYFRNRLKNVTIRWARDKEIRSQSLAVTRSQHGRVPRGERKFLILLSKEMKKMSNVAVMTILHELVHVEQWDKVTDNDARTEVPRPHETTSCQRCVRRVVVMRYKQRIENEDWLEESGQPVRRACCDCGLVHDLKFTLEKKNKIRVSVSRNERSTSAKRRYRDYKCRPETE